MNIDSTLGQRPAAQKPNRSASNFVTAVLPWIVASVALVVYLLTLNHWVSFGSLSQVARVAGWTWQPEVCGPLNWLLTLPLHSLPTQYIPLGLNLFSAVCAVLTLALLARSVALLPHNRTEQQRMRERSRDGRLTIRAAWVPPVLAALVCGLQLTFWESATAALGGTSSTPSNQMLDVLVFAYIIRCLLEFRVKDAESWLVKAALVYGLGVTNDWALIGFFPLFLAALIWLKGLNFFNGAFLARMSLCGMAGLLLYLALPLVQHFSKDSPLPFWDVLKYNLALQKKLVMSLPFNKAALFQQGQLWILALPSLLPLLIMAIRWPTYFGDPSRLGMMLSSLVFHIVHGALLLTSLWMCLDAPFSPRHMVPGLPFLTLYYLAALAIGYLSGYFLLVFGTKPATTRPQRLLLSGPTVFDPFILAVFCLIALLGPALLVYRNLPQIRTTNGPQLRQYVASMQQGISATNRAVLLSDDARLLMLMSAADSAKPPGQACICLDTTLLKWPDYLRFLNRQHPHLLSISLPKEQTQPLEDLDVMYLTSQMAQSNALYYLHPSFGYYFEMFYAETHGLIYRLKPCLTNSLLPAPPSPELAAENERFWEQFDQQFAKPLEKAASSEPGSSRLDQALLSIGLTKEANSEALNLLALASRARNTWGVNLQRGGQTAQAASHFQKAQELNPDNPSAKVNLEFNQAYQKGQKSSIQLAKSIEDQFLRYRNWNQLLLLNGPLDEPSLCFQLSQTLMQSSLFRQAGAELVRVKTLNPENYVARVMLSFLYLRNQMPRTALKEVAEIRAQPQQFRLSSTNEVDLMALEASAHLALKDTASAQATVSRQVNQNPRDELALSAAVHAFMNFECYSNALPLLEQQLHLNPTNATALVNQGFVNLQLKNYQGSIVPLSRALELETNNYMARFDRALAYLGCDQLEAAQRDYETIQKAYPTFYRGYYGLQEIAFRRKDTNAAIRNCELYLSHAPTNTAEAKEVQQRLQSLRRPGAAKPPIPAAPKGQS